MTSKIKVDNIHKTSDDSVIIKKCGSTTTVGSGSGQTIVVDGATVTLGRCGGSVALASGATQTGFGRTGTVDWVTDSIKTSTFTAESGKGYFCNTTGGSFEVDLPAGSAGAIVSIQDYNNTFDSNKLTVDPNGSEKINGGSAGDPIDITTEGRGVTFVYVDSTVGWRSVQDNDFSKVGESFVEATGGNVTTTVGNFKTHIFTSPGTFTVCSVGSPTNNTIDYLVVAGGGGGGRDDHPSPRIGGGAGAGGFRLSNSVGCMPACLMSPLINPAGLPVTATGYPVTVGAGGAKGVPGGCNNSGQRGSNSVFTGSSTITSTGGGGGGGHTSSTDGPGSQGPGGSAGAFQGYPGTGNSPPVSPPQGNPAGPGGAAPTYAGGGGGGAGAVGGAQSGGTGGKGGLGSFIGDTYIGPTAPSYGTSGPVSDTRYFAGGGGSSSSGAAPDGGGGGAANGGDATVNTGGGGAGGRHNSGNGGSGIVMIRYKFQ
jgi:hypothetical protein